MEEIAVAEAKAVNKLIRVPVFVHTRDGGYAEWRDVPGTEIIFDGVELKNGDTLTISTAPSANEDRSA